MLEIAIDSHQIDIALALIEKGADVNAINPDSPKSLLEIAIDSHQIDIALALVDKGANLNIEIIYSILRQKWSFDSNQDSALNLLKKIFVKQPDLLNKINSYQSHDYPLHLACINCNELFVEYFLHSQDIPADKRADPNKIKITRHGGSKIRESAIGLVCSADTPDSSKNLEMIDSLKRAGADLKFKDQEGFDLCKYALRIKGSSSFFEEIYQNRSPIEKIKNRLSGRDKKLLEMSAKEGNLECINFLYDQLTQSQGCFSCTKISRDELKDLFQITLKQKHFECAKLFLEKDSNIIDAINQNGDREIEISLKEFLEYSGERFMDRYVFDTNHVNRDIDIIDITLGKKIKFLVENNCEISEKFNEILANFRSQNPNPDQQTLEGRAVKIKLDFLERIENLINERRSPNPSSISAFALGQVAQVRAQVVQNRNQ